MESCFKAIHEYITSNDEISLKKYITKFNDDEKLSILTTNYYGLNTLHLCCKYDNLGLLVYLLNIESLKFKKTFLINLPTKDGDTCLLLGKNLNSIIIHQLSHVVVFFVLLTSLL
jgi:hypothetical protein